MPVALNPTERARILDLLRTGMKPADVAAKVGVGRVTVWTLGRKNGVLPPAVPKSTPAKPVEGRNWRAERAHARWGAPLGGSWKW